MALERKTPVAFVEDGHRRHDILEIPFRRLKEQLVHKGAGRVLRPPGRGAAQGRHHHSRTAAARQPHLGRMPVANHRIVGGPGGIDLRRAKKTQIHAAARAKVIKILIRKDGRRSMHEGGITARQRDGPRRFGVNAARDIEPGKIEIISPLGQQAGQHRQCRIDAGERHFIRADEAGEIDDDMGKGGKAGGHGRVP